MTIAGLLLFAAIYAAFVISPGPGVAAVVARGMAQGTRSAGAYIAGFVLGDLIWFGIATSGLAVIAETFEFLFSAIKYAGCGYLLYVAYKLWTAPVVNSEIAAAKSRVNGWNSFFGSLAIALSNPKVIVFFMSILPLVVDIKMLTGTAALELAGVIVLVFAPLQLLVLLGANQIRGIFRTERALQRLNRTTAGIMVGTAVAIAVRR